MPPRPPIARMRRRFAATATSTPASPEMPTALAPSSEASLLPPKAGALLGPRKPERPPRTGNSFEPAVALLSAEDSSLADDHSRPYPRPSSPRAPVSRPDQATRGFADRVHRGDRHVSRRAGIAAGVRRRLRYAGHRTRRRRRGRDQLPGRAKNRRGDGAHTCPAIAARRDIVAADTNLRLRHRGDRSGHPLLQGEYADDVAHACDVRRLRDRLHRAAEACDPAEYRDRRRLRRNAAGAGLGRSRE